MGGGEGKCRVRGGVGKGGVREGCEEGVMIVSTYHLLPSG